MSVLPIIMIPDPVLRKISDPVERVDSAVVKLMDDMLAANREAIVGGANWPMVFMQNAAIHALRGNATAALDALDQGYEAGWRDHRMLAIDPLLASLRKEPRFTALLSRIQADVAAMRARADYSRLP